jgi:hypothetical protein
MCYPARNIYTNLVFSGYLGFEASFRACNALFGIHIKILRRHLVNREWDERDNDYMDGYIKIWNSHDSLTHCASV